MAKLRVHAYGTLPSELESDAIYITRNGNYINLYVTSSDGTPYEHRTVYTGEVGQIVVDDLKIRLDEDIVDEINSKIDEVFADSKYALRTRSITGAGALSGGGNLTANRTLDLSSATKDDIQKGVEAYGYTLDDVSRNGSTTTIKISGSSEFSNVDSKDYAQMADVWKAGHSIQYLDNEFKLTLRRYDGFIISEVDLSSLVTGDLTVHIDDTDPSDPEIVFEQDGVEVGRIPASSLLSGVVSTGELVGNQLHFKDRSATTVINIDLSPVLDQKANKTVNFTAGTGLIGGGDLSENRIFSLDKSYTDSIYQTILLPGDNVEISENSIISAIDTKYTAGSGLTLSGTAFSLPVTTSGSGTFVSGIQQTTNGLTVSLGTPPDTNTTYSNMLLNELNAGTVTTARVISAKTLNDWLNAKGFVNTDTTYSAGSNISISPSNIISATDTRYTAGNGISLAGTVFSVPVNVSGDGTFVSSVVQSSGGISVTMGNPPNTTYTAMTVAEAEAGTATSSRLIRADRLGDIISPWARKSITITTTGTTGVSTYDTTTGVLNIPNYANTIYSNMSLAELNAGTLTTARTISAKTLTDWVTGRGLTASNVSNWNSAYGWGDYRDWGLGRILTTNDPNYKTDLNEYTNTGFSRFDNTEENRPFRYGTLYHARTSPSGSTQLALPLQESGSMSYRGQNSNIGGDYWDWKTLWDNYNLPNPATESWVQSQGFSTQNLSGSSSIVISGSEIRRAALTGDVTANANSNETTIANGAVTLGKMANLATQRLIGRATAGTGVPQAISLGSNLTLATSGVLSATDTTYTAGTLAQLNTGTSTLGQLWGAKTIADYVSGYVSSNLGLQGVTELGNTTTEDIYINANPLSRVADSKTRFTSGYQPPKYPDEFVNFGTGVQTTSNEYLIATSNINGFNEDIKTDMIDQLPTRIGIIDTNALWGNSITLGSDFGYVFGYSSFDNWVNIHIHTHNHHNERIANKTGYRRNQYLEFPPEDGTLATREWILSKNTTPPVGPPDFILSFGDSIYRLRAGDNLEVDFPNNKLNAIDTVYTAGSNVQISASNVITATNTTYSNMSLAELNAGTLTTARTISAKTLTDWVTGRGLTASNVSNWNSAYNRKSLETSAVTGNMTAIAIKDLNDLPVGAYTIGVSSESTNKPFSDTPRSLIRFGGSQANTVSDILIGLHSFAYRNSQNNTWKIVWTNYNLPNPATESWVQSQGFSTQNLSGSSSIVISGSEIRRAALTGDVTANANSNSTTISNDAITTDKISNSQVTYPKIQNVSGSRILGRGATTSGVVQEISIGSNLTMSTTGTTHSLSAVNTTYSQATLEQLRVGSSVSNRLINPADIRTVIDETALPRRRIMTSTSSDGSINADDNGYTLMVTGSVEITVFVPNYYVEYFIVNHTGGNRSISRGGTINQFHINGATTTGVCHIKPWGVASVIWFNQNMVLLKGDVGTGA